MPLFVVIIAVAIFGVAAGGMATWFRQRRWRRAARQHEADAREGAGEADLRAAAAVSRGGQPHACGTGSSAAFTGPPGETSGRDVVEPARQLRSNPHFAA